MIGLHELVLPFHEVGQGVIRQAHGGTFADHAPDPTALFLTELGFPAQFVNLGGSSGRVFDSEANHGQRDQLFGAQPQRQQLALKVVFGPGIDRADRVGPFGIKQAHRLGGNTQVVVFEPLARAQPDCLGLELSGLELLFCGGRTAVIGIALGQPQGLHLLHHIAFA